MREMDAEALADLRRWVNLAHRAAVALARAYHEARATGIGERAERCPVGFQVREAARSVGELSSSMAAAFAASAAGDESGGGS
jgi:hypothetical protein